MAKKAIKKDVVPDIPVPHSVVPEPVQEPSPDPAPDLSREVSAITHPGPYHKESQDDYLDTMVLVVSTPAGQSPKREEVCRCIGSMSKILGASVAAALRAARSNIPYPVAVLVLDRRKTGIESVVWSEKVN